MGNETKRKISGINSIKDVLEIIAWLAMALIAFLTLQVYIQQLKVTVAPTFEVSVVQEANDNDIEQWLQIVNSGKPIKSKSIETVAILWITKTENEEQTTMKKMAVKLDNYFFDGNNMQLYSNSKEGIIFKQETNFHYSDIQNDIVQIRLELNEMYDKTIQIYPDFSYYLKINYTDYADKNYTEFYEAGRFQNIEITESQYLKAENAEHSIDLGSKDYYDDLIEIIR